MLLDLVKQAAVADVQILRGAAAIPTEGFQRALNHLRFGARLYIAHNGSEPYARRRCVNEAIPHICRCECGDPGFQFPGGCVCVAHDKIKQFPQVSPPIVKKRNIHQPRGKAASKPVPHLRR